MQILLVYVERADVWLETAGVVHHVQLLVSLRLELLLKVQIEVNYGFVQLVWRGFCWRVKVWMNRLALRNPVNDARIVLKRGEKDREILVNLVQHQCVRSLTTVKFVYVQHVFLHTLVFTIPAKRW